ncbi:MAG: ATP-binding cassette domain-containing protein [Hyphomicrobium sp.]|nr:ATP-binding cassette domain-containing protein [Hyphomicrobium sp.]
MTRAPAAAQATGSEPVRPLLEAADLVKHFPIKSGLLGRSNAVVRAVDGVTFSLYPGETLGIVGESGCGKSTTARVLMNLIKPDSGNVLLNGRAPGTPELSLKAFRSQVQMVFQDSYASLNPRLTVEDSIAYGPTVHGVSGSDAVRRARRLLDLKEEIGLTYIFISHDLEVVRFIANRVMVMYLGRVAEIGPTDALYTGGRHPYTTALLGSMLSMDPAERTMEAPLAGDPRFGVLYQGRLYLCASKDDRSRFVQDPERYAAVGVEAGGNCPHCLAERGEAVPGDPRYSLSEEGRRFWFPDEAHRDAFMSLAPSDTIRR